MSMNFSEFKQWLGAEPRSSDPEFLRVRKSSTEFQAAAQEAERFEDRLELAARIAAPESLLDDLISISRKPAHRSGTRRWLPLAAAASLLIAVGAFGLVWRANHSWNSVEDYVAQHYRHDGDKLPAAGSLDEVQALFAGLDVQAAPALASIIGVIKYCPTPDGKGIHMILDTETGPVTVIYMPETGVADREMFAFDDRQVMLVELARGSAAIIGPDRQSVSGLYAFIQDSITPVVPGI
jgi:hypothetical protein